MNVEDIEFNQIAIMEALLTLRDGEGYGREGFESCEERLATMKRKYGIKD